MNPLDPELKTLTLLVTELQSPTRQICPINRIVRGESLFPGKEIFRSQSPPRFRHEIKFGSIVTAAKTECVDLRACRNHTAYDKRNAAHDCGRGHPPVYL